MSDHGIVLPGQRLRAEREARGMTEQEVARQLNLTVNYLKALEADDYERLPQATFIKGYIRNYARLLDIPGDELANTFEQVIEEDRPQTAQTSEQSGDSARASGRFIVIGVAVVVIALLAWLAWPSGEPEPVSQDVPEASADNLPESSAPESDETPSLPALEPEQQGDSAPDAEPASVPEGPTEVARAEVADDRLSVVFNEQCWVQVSDASQAELYEGQKPAGSRLFLVGQAPFSLKIGNAAAVGEINVNGEVVEMPTRAAGRVVRVSVP
jgi:cytoskeleton protein RodZ